MNPILAGIALFAIVLLTGGIAYMRGYRSGMTCGIMAARDEIRSTTEVAEHCRQQWADWEQKAESYRSLNSGILLERDKWQHLYREQSAAHGNAQAMMMGAIDYMGRKLSAAGIKFQISPVLEEVQKQFISDHVTSMLPETLTADNRQPAAIEKVQQKTPEVG